VNNEGVVYNESTIFDFDDCTLGAPDQPQVRLLSRVRGQDGERRGIHCGLRMADDHCISESSPAHRRCTSGTPEMDALVMSGWPRVLLHLRP